MDFAEARQRYQELAAQRRSGQIGENAYMAAVGQLRVQDTDGRWWAIDSENGQWLAWDGTSWTPAVVPERGVSPSPPPYTSGSVTTQDAPLQQRTQALRQSLDTKTFLQEAREKPLAQRSEGWWNAAAIFGGIISAILWFLYSSIRGVAYEGLDFLTPMLMVGIPVGQTLFRAPIDRMLMPLQKYRQRVSKLILVGAGLAAPFVVSWILYTVFRITQYRFLRWSVLVGSMASYAIVRTPNQADSPQRRQGVSP